MRFELVVGNTDFFFTTEGKYVLRIGGTGKEPKQFVRPHGTAMDSKGFFYVADSSNQRIQKFEFPNR